MNLGDTPRPPAKGQSPSALPFFSTMLMALAVFVAVVSMDWKGFPEPPLKIGNLTIRPEALLS